ncbi:transcription factor IIa [Novymonas esmeraldas]|uniref:Transcription factor IIa n=1 Tax=Novymonas esmeraldas TaxID=1808958 RepID=A0AAW0ER86_9TRYP
MYRQSIPGLALAAALAELQPALTARQEEDVWRIFDSAMQSTVAEAPLMSHIAVESPPPSSVSGGGGLAVVSQAPAEFYVPAAAEDAGGEDDSRPRGAESASAPEVDGDEDGTAAAVPFDDSDIAFPVYRLVDDEWTLLLKDPTVVVRNELGVTEKMQLDYLRVRLKDIGAQPGATQVKQTRPARKR